MTPTPGPVISPNTTPVPIPAGPGVYHVEANGNYYTGSAENMRARILDPEHPARALFDEPSRNLTTWDVDISGANPAATRAGSLRAAINQALRGPEQMIADDNGCNGKGAKDRWLAQQGACCCPQSRSGVPDGSQARCRSAEKALGGGIRCMIST